MTTLIIGGSGNVGLPLLRALAGRAGVTALVRTDEDAASARELDIAPVRGDLAEPASLSTAFKGVDRLFLLTPFVENQEDLENNALDAAEKAGVDHVVKLAYAGIDWPIDITQAHRTIQARLLDAPYVSTLLLAEVFATNVLGQTDLLRQGQFVLPGATARIGYVDPADVGQVAAALLAAAAPPVGRIVVTGPDQLTNDQVAAVAGRTLTGAPARYVTVEAEPFIGSLTAAGWPPFTARAVAEMHLTIAARGPIPTSDATQTWVGRPATPLADFLARVASS